jgi:hypothetical protein
MKQFLGKLNDLYLLYISEPYPKQLSKYENLKISDQTEVRDTVAWSNG